MTTFGAGQVRAGYRRRLMLLFNLDRRMQIEDGVIDTLLRNLEDYDAVHRTNEVAEAIALMDAIDKQKAAIATVEASPSANATVIDIDGYGRVEKSIEAGVGDVAGRGKLASMVEQLRAILDPYRCLDAQRFSSRVISG